MYTFEGKTISESTVVDTIDTLKDLICSQKNLYPFQVRHNEEKSHVNLYRAADKDLTENELKIVKGIKSDKRSEVILRNYKEDLNRIKERVKVQRPIYKEVQKMEEYKVTDITVTKTETKITYPLKLTSFKTIEDVFDFVDISKNIPVIYMNEYVKKNTNIQTIPEVIQYQFRERGKIYIYMLKETVKHIPIYTSIEVVISDDILLIKLSDEFKKALEQTFISEIYNIFHLQERKCVITRIEIKGFFIIECGGFQPAVLSEVVLNESKIRRFLAQDERSFVSGERQKGEINLHFFFNNKSDYSISCGLKNMQYDENNKTKHNLKTKSDYVLVKILHAQNMYDAINFSHYLSRVLKYTNEHTEDIIADYLKFIPDIKESMKIIQKSKKSEPKKKKLDKNDERIIDIMRRIAPDYDGGPLTRAVSVKESAEIISEEEAASYRDDLKDDDPSSPGRTFRLMKFPNTKPQYIFACKKTSKSPSHIYPYLKTIKKYGGFKFPVCGKTLRKKKIEEYQQYMSIEEEDEEDPDDPLRCMRERLKKHRSAQITQKSLMIGGYAIISPSVFYLFSALHDEKIDMLRYGIETGEKSSFLRSINCIEDDLNLSKSTRVSDIDKAETALGKNIIVIDSFNRFNTHIGDQDPYNEGLFYDYKTPKEETYVIFRNFGTEYTNPRFELLVEWIRGKADPRTVSIEPSERLMILRNIWKKTIISRFYIDMAEKKELGVKSILLDEYKKVRMLTLEYNQTNLQIYTFDTPLPYINEFRDHDVEVEEKRRKNTLEEFKTFEQFFEGVRNNGDQYIFTLCGIKFSCDINEKPHSFLEQYRKKKYIAANLMILATKLYNEQKSFNFCVIDKKIEYENLSDYMRDKKLVLPSEEMKLRIEYVVTFNARRKISPVRTMYAKDFRKNINFEVGNVFSNTIDNKDIHHTQSFQKKGETISDLIKKYSVEKKYSVYFVMFTSNKSKYSQKIERLIVAPERGIASVPKYTDYVKFIFVDVETSGDAARFYKIKSVPTILFFDSRGNLLSKPYEIGNSKTISNIAQELRNNMNRPPLNV